MFSFLSACADTDAGVTKSVDGRKRAAAAAKRKAKKAKESSSSSSSSESETEEKESAPNAMQEEMDEAKMAKALAEPKKPKSLGSRKRR